MRASWIAWLSLASLDQTSRLAAMREGLNEPRYDSSRVVVLAAAILFACVLVGGVWQVYQWGRRRSASRDSQLRRAARILGLTRSEFRLVRQVSRAAKISHPVSVLLSPANLAHAAHAAQTMRADPGLQRRMSRLAMKLYSRDLPEVAATQPRP